MSAAILITLSIVLLLAAIMFVRAPIALLLMGLGFLGYAALDGVQNAAIMVGNEFWSAFTNTGFTVIPLFVLMGQICHHSGLSANLYRAAASLLGHIPGGIAAATTLACGGFAAICGSNTATAATMSVVSLPQLRKYGYDTGLSAGVIATGTTLGAVIPPSVVAIVLAIETGQSIRKLFIGGIVPGLLLILLFLLIILFIAKRNPKLAPAGERADLKERIASLPGLLEIMLLFGLVVGGMSVGAFTPSEAGAAGSALAIVIGLLRKGLNIRKLGKAAMDSLFVSAMIFLLLAGAGCFGKFLAVSRAPFLAAQWVQSLAWPPLAILLLILLIYLLGGMIMDALALLLITLPIFFNLVVQLGYDPLWFCMVLVVITTMGAVTPPVGASAYVVASMAKIDLGTVFRGVVPFLPAYFICLVLMFLVPSLFMWLPGIVH